MSGFGVVLVGIDGSEVAEAALLFAAQEASRRGSRLVVVHGAEASKAAPSETEVESFGEILCREAIAAVADLDPHVECNVVRRHTDPAELLIELSETADLLVVGTHRMGRLRGFVLGSVSQRVAAKSVCPVITVSGPPQYPNGAIILGASATAGGLAALGFACEEARLRGVPIHAIRAAIVEDWAIATPGFAMVGGANVLYDAARIELNTVLQQARELYPDVVVNGEVSNQHPFVALLSAADIASMVVIGSRRREDSPLPHLGPVAAWLLHQAQCPLAVVGYTAMDTLHATATSLEGQAP